MYFRPAFLSILVLLFAAGSGCQKSQSLAPAAPPTVLSPDTTASIHWLGKKHIGIMASACYFTSIWQLPPSAQLERQTLYKLAAMPWQWLPGGTNLNSETASKLLLMLNDLVQEECYLEVRQPTNAAGEIVGEAYAAVTGDEDAEAAFVVRDSEQHRGIGGALLGAIVGELRLHGVRRLHADTMPGNLPMRALLRHSALPLHERYRDGDVEVTLQIG